jgi:eukaryotic-like serine/threonine-protein kinase
MPSNRWEEINCLYDAVVDLAEADRTSFLEKACAGDAELRREVESLLAYDKQAQPLLDRPALQVTAEKLAHESPSLVGRQLGPYQIQIVLGAGGMGEVYKAIDTRLNRTVAIKVLPRLLSERVDLRQRFEREGRAIASLNHPNICALYDIGRQDEIDFLVMEYVAGKTLDQRIPRKGLRLNETLKLAIQMADALAKAHSAGIVHRDLKPTNVMVTDEDLVKALDFGLAKLTELENDEVGTRTTQLRTEERTIVGTVSYMSPEQAEGKKIDARSDIFSFGAVLYEMVTGQRAFQGESKMSTLAAILNKDPKPVRSESTPYDLDKIITRCLRKAPERRWQTKS